MRPGFTLMEILVVLGITTIAISLSLPAINDAREASRRLQCQTRLRSLALAVHSYVDSNRVIPNYGAYNAVNHGFSPFSKILPYMERSDVYDLVNFNIGIKSEFVVDEWRWQTQATALNRRIAAFVCPSDSYSWRWTAPTSFRGNWGTDHTWSTNVEIKSPGKGFFHTLPTSQYGFEVFTDGLSQTAMFSERIVGDGISTGSPVRSPRDVVVVEAFGGLPGPLDYIINVCASAGSSSAFGRYRSAGKYWIVSGLHHTLYSHAIVPNADMDDCLSLASSVPPQGVLAARSYHQGVNLAFGDGSCRMINDGIDLAVWRSLSTYNAGDLLDHGF